MNKPYTDTQRMDWLETQCYEVDWSTNMTRVNREHDDRDFYGTTLREAIDAALADEGEEGVS